MEGVGAPHQRHLAAALCFMEFMLMGAIPMACNHEGMLPGLARARVY